MNISSKVVNFLKVTVLVSSLLYFGYFIFKNFEQFKNFSNFNIQTIAILLSLKFINIYLLSNLNIFILKNIGINLKNNIVTNGMLLLRESGGFFLNSKINNDEIFICANPAIHKKIIKILN